MPRVPTLPLKILGFVMCVDVMTTSESTQRESQLLPLLQPLQLSASAS